MLRNPIDQILSFHSRLYYLGIENILDLEEALEAEEDRKRGQRIHDNWESIETWSLLYRDNARYAQQVQRYLNATIESDRRGFGA